MKLLLEKWKKHLQEDHAELDVLPSEEEKPKVVCNCLCTDCVFNRDKQCITEEIDLDFAQTDEGKWICECLTYEVGDQEVRGPESEESLDEQ